MLLHFQLTAHTLLLNSPLIKNHHYKKKPKDLPFDFILE